MELLRAFLSSKKWVTAMATILSSALLHFGFDVSPEMIAILTAPAVGYVVAQGFGGDRKDAQREAIEAARVDAALLRENQLADEARREAQYNV